MVLRTQDEIWISPPKKEDSEKKEKEVEPIPWQMQIFGGQGPEFRDFDLVRKNYSFKKKQSETIAGHDTIHIKVLPKYRYRPSFEFWIDAATKMRLKYVRYRRKNEIWESFIFQKVKYNPTIPPDIFSTDGLELDKHFPQWGDRKEDPIKLDFSPFQPRRLPEGFEKRFERTFKGRNGITHFSFYSDGLAKLTLNQRKQTEEEKKKESTI